MSKTHSDPQASFLCDQNLGRLARWLRIMGFDTEYMRTWDENALKRARTDGRILLTRRREFASDRQSIVLKHDFLKDQLRCLDKRLKLSEKLQPYSRCSICNASLKYVKAQDVKNLVPEYVSTTREAFVRCPRCLRIYWKGTHTVKMVDAMHRIFSTRAGS
ncbi:MAG: Mut7-C RNAse domain-containing protein [Deltaproteobacteria bacterium]|jgi:uncharacterized protein with PIN domain|nr:Mut7-C RNAse domain-containing protein [Deltaproteobacteria bacterium]MDX9762199.1 Mut7-C RNAse domain-containing protein [Desulfomonilia bacterium]